MKKIFSILLVLAIIFSMAACGQNAEDTIRCINCNASIPASSSFCSNCGHPVTGDSNVTEVIAEPVVTEPVIEHQHAFSDADCLVPATCSCGATEGAALGHNYVEGICSRCNASDPDYIVPTLVYQDSRVIIHYERLTDNGVQFSVENLTDVTITIQAEALALNHISTDDIRMSDEVAPYSIGKVVAKCYVADIEQVGIISGQLRIVDFNHSFDTYNAPFVNVVINPNVAVTMPTVTDTLLYSDDRVNIYFKEINATGVYFTVENLTDVTITIQADAVSINKNSTNDITMSDDVAPRSVGVVCAKCSFGAVPAVVETVGGTLRIIDFNRSFRTYDATIINVPIEES